MYAAWSNSWSADKRFELPIIASDGVSCTVFDILASFKCKSIRKMIKVSQSSNYNIFAPLSVKVTHFLHYLHAEKLLLSMHILWKIDFLYQTDFLFSFFVIIKIFLNAIIKISVATWPTVIHSSARDFNLTLFPFFVPYFLFIYFFNVICFNRF